MLKLPSAEMDKDGLSPNDLIVLMTQLWCRDFHEYRGQPVDRTRVQISAAMLLYCFTSARTGEVYESTARRAGARESPGNKSDEELEARVIAACYKVCLKISVHRAKNILTLTLAFYPYHRTCGRVTYACANLLAGVHKGSLEKKRMGTSDPWILRDLQRGRAPLFQPSHFLLTISVCRPCLS